MIRRGLRTVFGILILFVLPVLLATTSTGTAAANPLPVPFDARVAVRGVFTPNQPPPGANDWNCKPSAAHPYPVVLVNGTLFTQSTAWQAGAPFLKNNGYCVFTFNYGSPWWLPNAPLQAVDDIPGSARELSAAVNKVLHATGAHQVDLVGWSQGGGIMPNYYINVMGGGPKVHQLVGIAPSNHGTTLDDVVFARAFYKPLTMPLYNSVTALAAGLTQQAIGDKMADIVYGHGDTRPGVKYTTIVSEFDEVVTPYNRQFLNGPNVTNILLQDGCDQDWADHLAQPYSKRTWLFVLNALSPSTAKPVPCFRVDPYWPGVR